MRFNVLHKGEQDWSEFIGKQRRPVIRRRVNPSVKEVVVTIGKSLH